MARAVQPDARFLIIDDQPANIRLLERILQQAGYGCLHSLTDPRQAVPACRSFRPDLILLDLMMPERNGLDVMEDLRPLTDGTYLPVLMLTADVTPESKRRALAAGVRDFLTKPFDVGEVLLRVGNLLETRSLYQELGRRGERRVQEQAELLEKARDTIVARDAEKKALESQLIQAQRLEAIGLLAGGIAHDFNNLLTVIIGYSEAALNGLGETEPTHHLIHEVAKAGERAASLTRQLLAFSRRQVLTPVILDLNALVADIEKMLRRLIGADITLRTPTDPGLGQVKADAGQIEQVLMNLAVNARDAMPRGGQLTVETRNVDISAMHGQSSEPPPGRWVMLAVSDTGCGMDQATMARMFEPFFTTKEVGKGTGLGLATVYGIIKQSGGCIEVQSEMGRGTRFAIYLPRIPPGPDRTNAAAAKLPALPRGQGRVLLVEDEQAVRSLGTLALQSAGYTVLEAGDGVEALELFEKEPQPVDMLITDLVMPRMNGRQLADRLSGKQPGLKVLYMSGYTDDRVVRQNLQEGGGAFLQKPFTPTVLARKVYEVLGH